MIIPHLRNSVSVVFSVIIFFVYSRDMTMGEIGCFLSHYLIWKDVSAFKFHSELNFLNIYIKKWVLLFDTFWGTFGWLIQFTTKFSKQKQFQLAIYKLLPQADTLILVLAQAIFTQELPICGTDSYVADFLNTSLLTSLCQGSVVILALSS